ncbi:hypothetical protein LSH36_562g01013 [Paralvinella palmiformis]|uniref:CRAL-TRIO domain-containing protein n=1 Tax=Paralvinella palmiformis TaxID=53620 RepID=A0AAD9MX02_9ANNE|nr:hypothetical protein LSH36_562g01013 [Paralvinella palmiformis]
MAQNGNNPETTEEDFKELKSRCQLLFNADPAQTLDDNALKRFLRAFKNVDAAFTAIVKCNNWRRDFGVQALGPDDEDIREELITRKITVLRHRDIKGRPIIYVSAKRHNANDRDINKVTKFIVYILENACKRCCPDVIDNMCLVFDLKDFSMNNMDYQFVKNLIWLLSKYYPERLGVCLVINAPRMFTGCWSVIRPWLNDVTASKVTFVSNEQDLCQYLIPDMLPTD